MGLGVGIIYALARGYVAALMKILIQRNRFIGFLLVIEFMVILTITLLLYRLVNSGSVRLTLFFLVLSVCLSCLGLGIIISLIQVGVKEIELFSIKI